MLNECYVAMYSDDEGICYHVEVYATMTAAKAGVLRYLEIDEALVWLNNDNNDGVYVEEERGIVNLEILHREIAIA